MQKICTKCLKSKDLDEFRKDKGKKDGHENACKECRRLEQRIAYKEKGWKEVNKRWAQANINRTIVYAKKWRDKNKELLPLYDARRRKNKSTEELLFNSAKKRAKKIGLEFNIEITDVIVPEKCPLLGTPLTNQIGKGYNYKNCSNRASIDRINSNKGYIKGNVWVISSLANMMKSKSSISELKTFCINSLKLIKNGTIYE